MSDSTPIISPFSATVSLALGIGERTYDLAEAGPDAATLRRPESVPAGPATVIVTIDGQRRVSQVWITGQEPDGRHIWYSR